MFRFRRPSKTISSPSLVSTSSGCASFCDDFDSPCEQVFERDLEMAERAYLPSRIEPHPECHFRQMCVCSALGSKIYKTVRKKDRKTVCVKLVRNHEDETRQQLVRNEVVMSALCGKCEYIPRFYEAFQSKDYTWLIMEWVQGCNLKQLTNQILLEPKHVAFAVQCVLLALQWMHDRHRAHRDVKSSNIMINRDGHVMLMDFGFAKQFTVENPSCYHSVGTLMFMAPEVVACQSYTYEPDVWSLGIVVYDLLCGSPPMIRCQTIDQAAYTLMHCEPPRIHEANFDPFAKDFIHQCLTKDPTARPTVGDLLTHPFLLSACSQQEWLQFIRQAIPTWPTMPPEKHSSLY